MERKRSARRHGGLLRRLFGRRSRNRRVRLTGAELLPSLNARRLGQRMWSAARAGRRGLVATLAVVLLSGGAFGLHRFLTRSKHFAVAEVRFSSLEHADLDTLR